MRGHPEVFTTDQNAELRAALRELQRQHNHSQAALGALLGIAQQTAGRLLRLDAAGFSYASATRLVRACGFGGVDSFFRARGVALASSPPPAMARAPRAPKRPAA
jgi:hypothetical protein